MFPGKPRAGPYQPPQSAFTLISDFDLQKGEANTCF